MSPLLRLPPEPPANTLRFADQHGHIESYFLRATHPTRPLAVWLKATILAPHHGPAVAESWFIWFDGERGTTFAHKETRPFSTTTWTQGGDGDVKVELAGHAFDFQPIGSARGTVTAPAGTAKFDLTWRRDESPIARPFAMYPTRFLRTGPFPKAKSVTPFPSLFLSGRVELPDGVHELKDWRGSQGHNWGKEHTFEYAWGQCVFPDDDVFMEGGSARVRYAGAITPRLSKLTVRKGARTFSFDRIFDPWRQRAEVATDSWSLGLRSDDGEVLLEMDAAHRPMVCLGYDNPDGQRSYCFNSKLAAVKLTVRPSDGASFTCVSPHGGALELLRREPDPRFPNVV